MSATECTIRINGRVLNDKEVAAIDVALRRYTSDLEHQLVKLRGNETFDVADLENRIGILRSLKLALQDEPEMPTGLWGAYIAQLETMRSPNRFKVAALDTTLRGAIQLEPHNILHALELLSSVELALTLRAYARIIPIETIPLQQAIDVFDVFADHEHPKVRDACAWLMLRLQQVGLNSRAFRPFVERVNGAVPADVYERPK